MKTPSQFFILALVALGSHFAYGDALQTCKENGPYLERICKQQSDAAKKEADGAADSAKAASAGKGQSKFGENLQSAADISSAAFSKAKEYCEKRKEECKRACDPSQGKPEQQSEIQALQKKCEKNIKKIADGLGAEEKQNTGAGKDAGKTKDAAQSDPNQQQQQPQQQQGQQQPQQSPPQSPQSPQTQQPQDQSKDQSKMPGDGTQTGQTDECAGSSDFAGSTKCTSKNQASLEEYCKSPAVSNNDPKCADLKQKLSVQSFCASGGTGSCPSCRGMSAQSLSSASQSDLQNMCTGSCASDPVLGPNLADRCRSVIGAKTQSFNTAATAASGGAATGGSGSASGGSAVAGRPSLDDGKKQVDGEGKREGQSLAVNSAGGFSGYGDSGGSGSLFGTESTSGSGGNAKGAAARAVASSIPADVGQKNGITVFRIFSDVIKTRCDAGRLLHCGPYK